jgi:hypothetical protein
LVPLSRVSEWGIPSEALKASKSVMLSPFRTRCALEPLANQSPQSRHQCRQFHSSHVHTW